MSGILKGIRVIDWGIWYVVPGGTALLADMGADVIHVEQRGLGDPMRGLHTSMGSSQIAPNGRQVTYEYGNRNKRGISLDLSKPEGIEIMRRLLKNADMFIHNFRETSAKKLGLSYEDVKKLNEKIIYIRASAFGPKGPDSGVPGLDLVAAARSGLYMASGDARVERGEPHTPPIAAADEMGATMVAFAALAGLVAREREGISQEINVSQLGASLRLIGFLINQNLLLGVDVMRQERMDAANPLYNIYKCRDGKWIALALLPEKEWFTFCQCVGQKNLAENPEYATASQRAKKCREIVKVLDELFLTRDREEWENLFRAADLMFSPVNTIPDLATDPQMLENEYITTFDHPAFGKTKWVGFPIQFSKTPMIMRSAAPEYGQHNLEVLTEVCGYTEEEVVKLYEQEVV